MKAALTSSPLKLRVQLARDDFTLDVDLELPGRGVSAVFGHSGSGKTTLLRCVAGLEQAPVAYVEIGGEIWQDTAKGVFVPTHRRALGVVFQEASLFPHLSVRGNLQYGQKRAAPHLKQQGAMAPRRVDFTQAVDLFGIAPLLERQPATLSGGERQRVAMARALLAAPRILLMDEPLAALDLKRKQEILPYLERLHGELDIPVLYVSHSPDEVARLADHVVLLDAGRAVASGPLGETLARLDLPAAFADDAGVVVDAVIGEHDDADHLSRLDFPGGAIYVARHREALGVRVRCRIHARDVSLSLAAQDGISILNRFPAIVVGIADTDNPAQVLVRLDAGGAPLLARVTRRSARQLALTPGLSLWAAVKAVALL